MKKEEQIEIFADVFKRLIEHLQKRTDLIHSGAHQVIPDYYRKEPLTNLLIND